MQPLWLCHLLNSYGLQRFTKYFGYFVSLHFSVSYFLPSFILTCCWKCNYYPILLPPALTWGLSLCCCCYSAFYLFSLSFLCSLSWVLGCWLLCLLLEVSPSTLPTLSGPFHREEQHVLGGGSSSILWLLLMALLLLFTPVHGNDSPSSVSFLLPVKVLPYFAFMPLN